MIDRREFVVIVGVGLLAQRLTAAAQQSRKVPRVGVLGRKSPDDPFLAAFRQGLRELGYVDGQNIAIEYRFAHGQVGPFSKLAAELIRLDVNVLVVGGTDAALAAKAHTKTVPIVFTLAGDPVGSGLVPSFAHPGSNATGTTSLTPELSRKHLELL